VSAARKTQRLRVEKELILRSFTPPPASLPSKFISIQNFAALYGAAEFSLLNGYPLASHIIVNWTALGIDGDKDVVAGFLAFTKCLRDFLTHRTVPPLWIYAHERGPKTGWHTHMAIFLPVDNVALRAECMDWLRSLPLRQLGHRVPHAMRMRIPKAHDTNLHWLIFNYVTKSYDPSAVVQSARHAPGGKPIMLGDLITFPWRDPGVMTLRKRVGFSQGLGPAEQADGMPAAWSGLRKPGGTFRMTASSPPSTLPTPPRFAFRSTFDDARYDVRQLYGAEFCEWVAGARAQSSSASATDDASWVIDKILGGYI
jgi:hypothetical protein